jgi:hypothetical protein
VFEFLSWLLPAVLIESLYQLLQAVLMLKPEEQLELFHHLEDSLFARGILAPPA